MMTMQQQQENLKQYLEACLDAQIPYPVLMDLIGRKYVAAALARNNNKKNPTALLLGIHRNTMARHDDLKKTRSTAKKPTQAVNQTTYPHRNQAQATQSGRA